MGFRLRLGPWGRYYHTIQVEVGIKVIRELVSSPLVFSRSYSNIKSKHQSSRPIFKNATYNRSCLYLSSESALKKTCTKLIHVALFFRLIASFFGIFSAHKNYVISINQLLKTIKTVLQCRKKCKGNFFV